MNAESTTSPASESSRRGWPLPSPWALLGVALSLLVVVGGASFAQRVRAQRALIDAVIESDGYNDGVRQLAGLRQLFRIGLAGCAEVTDDGLRSLAGTTSLNEVRLVSLPGISDEGLRPLAGMRQLRALSYGRTVITSTAARALLDRVERDRDRPPLDE